MFLLGKLFEFSVEQRVTGWNLTTGDVGTGWDDRQLVGRHVRGVKVRTPHAQTL